MNDPVPFEALSTSDLFIDRVYAGGTAGSFSDDPLQRLLPVGNQGGIRYSGSMAKNTLRLVVLYTTGDEREWPDQLDPYTGTFTYFGDNRSPGSELHATTRSGNAILKQVFEWAHGDAAARRRVPPVLVFEKAGRGRDVKFRGLAAPGSPNIAPGDDLVAVWRMSEGERFQNYKASFTILDESNVTRQWLNDVLEGSSSSDACPAAWKRWVEKGAFTPLITERVEIRSRASQQPVDSSGHEIIDVIHTYFNEVLGDPVRFEACAVAIWRMFAPSTGSVDLTRPWRDGGRDAVGDYLIGPVADKLAVAFALEAKCYAPGNSVGVREMSRLISRLRFRQFGVFVTTSYFHYQTYEEVRADGHPVVLIPGRDIVEALASIGHTTPADVRAWLESTFPPVDVSTSD